MDEPYETFHVYQIESADARFNESGDLKVTCSYVGAIKATAAAAHKMSKASSRLLFFNSESGSAPLPS